MSPAYCFGCAFKIARAGTTPADPAAALQPLGACWDCRVFGCSEHAERDRVSLKWICFPSVCKALSVAAGLDDDMDEAEPSLRLDSSEDFERRFPRLADATREQRDALRERRDELVDAAADLGRGVDGYLLADAVGVGVHLLAGPEVDAAYFAPRQEETEEETNAVLLAVLPDRLAALVRRLPDG